MPKNKGKGGKNRRRGKNENESTKREIVLKEDGQEYALVLSLLGNGKLALKCFDNVKRIGHIRGKLRKKVWISVNDVILISIRDYQDDRCDVIMKYNADEVRWMKNNGIIKDIAEDQKNEVIKFSLEGQENIDSGDEDILANLMGTKNLNRPTQEMLDGYSDDDSSEEEDDSDEEDSDEDDDSDEDEEESDEEESEEEKPNYKSDKNSKTQQQLDIERMLSGIDLGMDLKKEKDYSINKVKTKTSTFSDMVDKDEEDEEEEAPTISNADLIKKLDMFQASIKDFRATKSSKKK